MIDYDTYVLTFGARNEKNNDRHVSISRDVYEILNNPKRLGIAFENEINLTLMEDVMVRISTAMMNNDKDDTLKSWKKVGEVIKKVLTEFKGDENELNDRYYEMSLSPSERDLFLDNPRILNGSIVGKKQAQGIVAFSKFYRAMCTDVGEAVRVALVTAQKKAVEDLYEAKSKNGTCMYYDALKETSSNWSRRIAEYEAYSSSLKIINRSVKNV
jgi:hypothetical protein